MLCSAFVGTQLFSCQPCLRLRVYEAYRYTIAISPATPEAKMTLIRDEATPHLHGPYAILVNENDRRL